MANLYDKAQYIYIAGAYKSGSVYGIDPIPGTTNITLESSSTFRASSGSRLNSSGQIALLGPGILRPDYWGTSSCASYLFEPQRTNFILNSHYLTTGSNPNGWAGTNMTWSLAAENTSPLGTNLAGLITETAVAGNHAWRNTPQVGSTTTGTFTDSVYVKRVGSDARNLVIQAINLGDGTYPVFILEGTGSIVRPAGAGSGMSYVSGSFIEQLPNGWYRCSILGYNPGGQTRAVRLLLASGSTYSETYTGTGTAGLYVVAVQMESGSGHGIQPLPGASSGTFVTSYMSSSADASSTRAGDYTLTLPSSSNSSAWTYFMTWKRNYLSNVQVDFALKSGSSGAYFGMYNNGVAIWDTTSSGGPGTATSGASLPIGQEYKFAIRYDSNGNQVTWFLNGSKRFSITWPTTGAWGNPIVSGDTSNSTGGSQGSFYVRSTALFNQSLTDAECQLLTATGSGTV
jgi:hypothetical protein